VRVHRSVAVARALVAQRLQPVKGLLFSIVGASGFLLEGIGVLTVKPRESRRPAVAHFMIAENEPLGLNLGGCRHSGGEKGSDESASEAFLASSWRMVLCARSRFAGATS
jgi:hypothetical protein